MWGAIWSWVIQKALGRVLDLGLSKFLPSGSGFVAIFAISVLLASHWWAYSRGVARTEAQYEAALADAEARDAATQAAIDAAQDEAREADLALQRLRKSLEDQDQEVIHAIRTIEVEVSPEPGCNGIDCPYPDRLLRLIYQ